MDEIEKEAFTSGNDIILISIANFRELLMSPWLEKRFCRGNGPKKWRNLGNDQHAFL